MAVKCERCRKADTTTGGGPYLTCLNCGAVLLQDGSLPKGDEEPGNDGPTFDEDAPWEPYGLAKTEDGFIDPNPTVSYSSPGDVHDEPVDTGFGMYDAEAEKAEVDDKPKAHEKAKAGKK